MWVGSALAAEHDTLPWAAAGAMHKWWLQIVWILNVFSLQSLLTADPAGNARLYLALYHFIPWHRLSPPFLLQSLSLLPQASPTVKMRDLKTDHTVTQWCHALSYHRGQVIEQTFSFTVWNAKDKGECTARWTLMSQATWVFMAVKTHQHWAQFFGALCCPLEG